MIELTHSIRKTVSSLDRSKGRKETGLFKAEGVKCVKDTLNSFDLQWLIITPQFYHEKENTFFRNVKDDQIIIAPKIELDRISHLSTPTDIIAIYKIPYKSVQELDLTHKLVLALDGVQDPGNIGTIIRAADWFGVKEILCSQDTVDAFSPKAVMASMGAISRVQPLKCDLRNYLSQTKEIIYGTSLSGDNIYTVPLTQEGIIVMGNEGNGISSCIEKLVNKNLYIPPYPGNVMTSESLNVGIATAIILSEFRRRAI